MGQCPRFAVHIEKIKNEKIKEKPTKKKKNFQDSLGNSQWKRKRENQQHISKKKQYSENLSWTPFIPKTSGTLFSIWLFVW
jgi:methyl coenzyme M reductase alpha subunit